MFTITYFDRRTHVLRSISTPVRVTALDTYGAMRRAGFVTRAWHNGTLLGWRTTH